MRGKRMPQRKFRFHFGQRVRVLRPHHDAGATGQVIGGRVYPDGKEIYAVDVPGGSWVYDAGTLEDADSTRPL